MDNSERYSDVNNNLTDKETITMKKEKPMGLLLNGSMRSSGVTFYLKKGRMVARSAHSMERRSNTREQFIQRQRMRNTVSLWQSL